MDMTKDHFRKAQIRVHAKRGSKKRGNPPETYVSDGPMAERVGFEPTEGDKPSTDFESVPL